MRAPEVSAALAQQVAGAVARLREMEIAKRPGVAEAIDWAHALAFLGVDGLDTEAAAATLGAVLKDHDDLELARAAIGQVVGGESWQRHTRARHAAPRRLRHRGPRSPGGLRPVPSRQRDERRHGPHHVVRPGGGAARLVRPGGPAHGRSDDAGVAARGLPGARRAVRPVLPPAGTAARRVHRRDGPPPSHDPDAPQVAHDDEEALTVASRWTGAPEDDGTGGRERAPDRRHRRGSAAPQGLHGADARGTAQGHGTRPPAGPDRADAVVPAVPARPRAAGGSTCGERCGDRSGPRANPSAARTRIVARGRGRWS